MRLIDKVLNDWWDETHKGEHPDEMSKEMWKEFKVWLRDNSLRYAVSIAGMDKRLNEEKPWEKMNKRSS